MLTGLMGNATNQTCCVSPASLGKQDRSAKKLGHVIVEVGKSKVCRVIQQAVDPGEPTVWFSSKGHQARDPRRANVPV